MSSKILVIGTNGFLGKHIKGLFEKEKESIFEIQGKSQVDLTREEEIESYLSQNSIEKIINCSAFVGGISYGGVQHIVNPISNCAYPGNLEVYKEENFWEGPPHSSVFYYGLSRRNIVAISSSFQQQHSLETSNVVLSNMYGPKDHFDIDRSHALGALVKKVCDAKMNDENEVEIWGSGEPIREWLYVEDGARALIKSLELNKPHQLFNVGINEGISIKDLAHKILSEVDWSGEFKFDVSKPDGVKRKTVDGSLGQELLQWTPGIDIDTGIKMTVDWYMSNHE